MQRKVYVFSQFKVQSVVMGKSRQPEIESAEQTPAVREQGVKTAPGRSAPPHMQSKSPVREWHHPYWVDLPTPINEL